MFFDPKVTLHDAKRSLKLIRDVVLMPMQGDINSAERKVKVLEETVTTLAAKVDQLAAKVEQQAAQAKTVGRTVYEPQAPATEEVADKMFIEEQQK